MSDFQPWEAQPYSAAAKRRSLEEYEERRAAEEAAEAEARTLCHCDQPVPGYRIMGRTPCVICRKAIR